MYSSILHTGFKYKFVEQICTENGAFESFCSSKIVHILNDKMCTLRKIKKKCKDILEIPSEG